MLYTILRISHTGVSVKQITFLVAVVVLVCGGGGGCRVTTAVVVCRISERVFFASALFQLSDVEKGGHTVFTRSKISVAPKKVHTNTRAHARTHTHARTH